MTGTDLPAGQEPCAAGIVIFNPEPAALIVLLQAAMAEASTILLFQNSNLPSAVEQFLATGATCPVVRLGDGTNAGLGAAYNQFLKWAHTNGFNHIALFDQDSLPSPGMLGKLLAKMQRLAEQGCNPAVLGPSVVDSNGVAFARPPLRNPGGNPLPSDCLPLDFIISSGSMIDVTAFAQIGPFRSDFFIDFIDVEWCARANALGYSCWMSPATPMTHRLGSGVVRLPFIPLALTRQPPARAYTFIRNQIALLRLAHVPLRQKLRTAARLVLHTAFAPLIAQSPATTLQLMLLGWRHGIQGRLGPPPPN